MPTKKQRRRRAKELRHEWEEVYVDEHGREVAPDEVEEVAPAGDGGRSRARGAPADPRRRPARAMQPPSWRRVGKRALIFAPFMFIFMTVLDPSTPVLARAVYTLQLMLLFVPFSYAVDAMMYRVWRRQQRAERA